MTIWTAICRISSQKHFHKKIYSQLVTKTFFNYFTPIWVVNQQMQKNIKYTWLYYTQKTSQLHEWKKNVLFPRLSAKDCRMQCIDGKKIMSKACARFVQSCSMLLERVGEGNRQNARTKNMLSASECGAFVKNIKHWGALKVNEYWTCGEREIFDFVGVWIWSCKGISGVGIYFLIISKILQWWNAFLFACLWWFFFIKKHLIHNIK